MIRNLWKPAKLLWSSSSSSSSSNTTTTTATNNNNNNNNCETYDVLEQYQIK